MSKRQCILYLSIIRDLFDNSIVAYKTGTTQSVNLVLDTIKLTMKKEKKVADGLQLHSDQGSQYTSQAYFDLTKEYGITPSMSRRGNCYDNAMAENFFSIIKTECIYRHHPSTYQEAKALIDNYIYFYNNQRIQLITSYQGSFLYCPNNLGLSSPPQSGGFFISDSSFYHLKSPEQRPRALFYTSLFAKKFICIGCLVILCCIQKCHCQCRNRS
jgi:putative transposase